MARNLNTDVLKVGMEVISKEPIAVKVGWCQKVVGTVKKIEDDLVTVESKVPIIPASCIKCGWPGFLSLHANTGEIECLRSGCGHGQGFEKVLTNVPVEKLELYADYCDRKKKEEWLEKRKQSKRELENVESAHRLVLDEGRKNGWIK